MISFREHQKHLQWVIALILVFSGLHLFAAPQSARARIVEYGSQMQAHSAPADRSGKLPSLTTRFAIPLAAPAPDSTNTNEDTPIDINVLGNDTGGPFTLTGLITTTTQGSVSINPDNTVHYDPRVGLNHLAASQVYTDTFQYTVISGTVPTNTPVSVRVTGVNDLPSALGDSLTTDENTAANVTVLVNDTDPDAGDVLTVTSLITTTLLGSARILPNNLIHYDPVTAFDSLGVGATGTTSLGYTVGDGHGGTASATVNITVNGANDNPTAAADSASTTEDAAIDISVLANDSDPDTGDTLTVTSLNTTGLLGNATINANNTIHYNPGTAFNYLQQGQNGATSFSYTVSDGHGGTSSMTVSVTVTGVNDLPVAVNDTATTGENMATDVSVLANDTDPDTGTTLSVTALNTAGLLGTATINPNYTIHYDPGIAFDSLGVGATATTSFAYTISDGHGSTASATASITINGANDIPTAAADSASTSEDAATDIIVLSNDSDPDTGDTLTVTSLNTTGLLGIASINANNTIHYNPGTAFNYLQQGQNGTTSFQYTVSDGHGGTSSATVSLSVAGVNDPPVAVNDAATTGENTVTDVSVLANDTDPDTGTTLSVTALNTTGLLGTATINPNYTIHYDPGAVFNYLAVGQNGTTSFQYAISDGHGGTASATVNLTVAGANDNPTAVSDSFTTNENTAPDFNLVSNDTDPDTSDVLTIQSINIAGTQGAVTINSGNTSVHYNPITAFNNLRSGQTAVDSFQYTVSDGHSGTSTTTVTVMVTGVNDNPTPANDTATTSENTATDINVLSNDTDPEGDAPLTVTGLITTGTRGSVTINANNTIHYNPGTAFDSLAVGATGNDTFQYAVSDSNGGSANATVTVTINGANDNPTPVSDGVSTGENTTSTFSVLVNDSDPDSGDTLTISGLNNTSTMGTVVINAGNTSVRYDPGTAFNYLRQGQTATDTFGYTVGDGHGGAGSATVIVTINGMNDVPTANKDTYTTPANTPLNVAAPGVLANDTDLDSGDPKTAVLVPGLIVPSSSLNLNANGSFIYTPAPNYYGLDHFIYHASDGIASSNNVTVTIGVNVTNQPPVVLVDAATTPEDTSAAIYVTNNDSDPDPNDGLDLSTLRVIISPTHGTTQVNTTTGVITYQPALNYNGIDAFRYEIYDNDSVLPLSGSAPVTVTVTPVNDPPQATSLNLNTQEDTPLSINLTGIVSDVDNNLDAGTLQVITPAGHGTAAVMSNLIITYSPAPNYNGPDQFGYGICDLGSLCATANISLNVEPVNDPPLAADDHYYSNPISLTVAAPGVLANDIDVDKSDLITATIVQTPNGLFSLNSDGSFTFVPELEPGKPVFTDTFKYRAYDGEAYSKTAIVTITIDTVIPQVGWVEPVTKGGQIYYPGSNELIPVVITATDNLRVASVELIRWDAVHMDWVNIINFTHGPYTAEINTRQLNFGWNQIYLKAYDEAGNMNDFANPQEGGFIWIYRKQYLFMPLLTVGRMQ